jgi:hypothetical protein
MQFTAQQLGVINWSLRTTWDEKERKDVRRHIDISEQEDAAGIAKQIFENTEEIEIKDDNGEVVRKDHRICDGELELSTSQKALILKYLDRPCLSEEMIVIQEVRDMLK